MLETYINQIIIDLEINEDVSNDVENCYELQLDENINVIIKNLLPGYYFIANIAQLPKTSCEDLLSNMMSGNLFGIGTEKAVLGLNENGSTITLSQSIIIRNFIP